ncbi:MAG TPA: PEP-utilizing enzyme [Armatimonadota bacterium]|nr:PEP-utilizing enzyme [Armatimonadota bacterium]
MNRIRKQFGREVEALCPVLHETYARVGAFQTNRTPRNEERLLAQLDEVAPLLEFFRPWVPGPKQAYFMALAEELLDISDRIIALDVAVGALHIDFPMERAYMHRESRRLREVLEMCRVSDDDLATDPLAGRSDALLTGIPASPGVALGTAAIASKTSDYRNLQRGSILVTTMPRPEFVEHLQAVKGIVTDTGGRLCHAAIVARELRVPCVVGTERATRRIKPGWQISVNGTTGEVRRTDR